MFGGLIKSAKAGGVSNFRMIMIRLYIKDALGRQMIEVNRRKEGFGGTWGESR